MDRGRLITIEGLDGAGKTTLALALHEALTRRGLDVRLLREPGGVRVAERVRDLVTDPELNILPRAEVLLYAAARAQLVEEAIEPLLEGGTWVVLDRFIDSSLAYQGGGRGLGIGVVREINDFSTNGLTPDRTLLLMVDPAIGRARSRGRPEALDRLEREEEQFFRRTESAYLELWKRDTDRIRKIDATQPPERVLAATLDELADLI